MDSLVTYLWLFFPYSVSEISGNAFKKTLLRILSHHTGNMVAGTSEVIAVCQSLQQVAEKCQQDPESCWYFHQTAVPCLFALAVQASMPGEFLHPTPSLAIPPLDLSLPLILNSTVTLRLSLVFYFIPVEASFESFVPRVRFCTLSTGCQPDQWQESKSTCVSNSQKDAHLFFCIIAM